MTTFASTFSSFSNMQAEEDFDMDVTNDPERKNAMAMEEDHFDIDLDLIDEPANGHDEDSMMDDDLSGQVGDQDQQMNDDYEEQGDQDEDILDYFDTDQPEVVEVPMTEEVASQQQDHTPSLHNLFATDAVPETPAFPSFSSHSPIAQAQAQAEQPQQVQNDHHNDVSYSTEVTASHPTEGLAKPESSSTPQDDLTAPHVDDSAQHRSLTQNHQAPEPTTSPNVDTSREHADQKKPAATETKEKPDPNPTEAPATHASADQVLASLEGTDSKEAQDVIEEPAGHAKENIDDVVAGTSNPVHADGVHEGAWDDAAHEDHEDHAYGDEATYGHDTTDNVEPVLPVLVTYQGHQMSLFPPTTQEQGTPELYLLADSAVFDSPIDSFLKVCREALKEGLSETEDIEAVFPSFGLTFRKCDPQAAEYTLRHIAELYCQFQQFDDIDKPEPLQLTLSVQSTLAGRMGYLYDLAGEGKGLKYVEDLLNIHAGETGYEDFDDEYVPQGGDANEEYGDEAGIAHVAAGQQDADGNVAEQAERVAHETHEHEHKDERQEHDDADAEGANDVDEQIVQTASKNIESNSRLSEGTPTVPANAVNADAKTPRPQDEANAVKTGVTPDAVLGKQQQDAHEHVVATTEDADLVVNAQTAEEIDFNDEEWDIDDDFTNTDTTNIADAQEPTIQNQVETSQSLHSATQPDASAAIQPHSVSASGQVNEPEDLVAQPAQSPTSSTTLQGVDHVISTTTIGVPDDEEEDIFGDEEDAADIDTAHDQGDLDEIDFDDIEDQVSKSPSLKRVRSEVDGVGGEAGEEEDQPLKRSRSG